jgi:SAM-dependent methyltransferase
MTDIAHRRHFATPEELDKVRRYQEITWHYIESFFDNTQGKDVLDVGASEGWLKKFVRGNYCAIDISPLGDYVLPGTILQVGNLFPDKRFDLIVYEHVLEHVDSPLENLYAAFQIMKPLTSFLFIAVPYVTAPWAWEETTHLHLFNEVNLLKMLIKAGFTPIEWLTLSLRKDAVELWMVSKKL